MTKKFEVAGIILICGLISFFYYAPFLDNFFVWDDFWLLDNATGDLYKVLFGWQNLRVVGNLILGFNHLIAGYDPTTFTLIGITAHIVNSVLLYIFLCTLSEDRLFSFISTIIFAASGVFSDAIFWRAAFLTFTGFFFYIFVLYLYVKWKKSGQTVYQTLAMTMFVFAIFNKESAASIPFAIIFIELIFFKGKENLPLIIKRVTPYFAIIILFIALSKSASHFLGMYQEQLERFLSFRPLHTLFSGYSAFYIAPGGFFSWTDPGLYLFLLFIPLSFIMTNNKKWLYLGYGWIFITFIPQSLSAVGMYSPKYLFNSLSRSLYLPAVGPAIVFTLCLLSFKERFQFKYFVLICCIFFTCFVSINYGRVQSRGNEWRKSGPHMKRFIYALKKVIPDFPKNSYIHVVNAPTGRAYVQRSLRGFYKTNDIFWVDNPTRFPLGAGNKTYEFKKGDSLFIIYYNWGPGAAVRVKKLR